MSEISTAFGAAMGLYEVDMQKLGWFRGDKLEACGDHWWWNEDPNGGPLIVNIIWCSQSEGFVATPGQNGWTIPRDAGKIDGWWQRCEAPKTARHPGW